MLQSVKQNPLTTIHKQTPDVGVSVRQTVAHVSLEEKHFLLFYYQEQPHFSIGIKKGLNAFS